jgi:5-methylcytosine-specific restriction endonuclease McrA
MAKISKDLDQKIRRQAKNRCGYCLNPQRLPPFKPEIEHIHPQKLGGTSTKENLCLACRHCNLHKSTKIFDFDVISAKKVKLFNPNGKYRKWLECFII